MSPGPDRGQRSWSALSLRVPLPVAEELLARFAARSLGAWTPVDATSDDRLRIYFGTRSEAEAAAEEASTTIAGRGIAAADCEVRVEEVPDERWVERYQAGLAPFPFAGRFVVSPEPVERERTALEGRIVLRLVPGRAFGTGEHPTTELSARLLERRVGRDESWVDLGCGSAILSLVALHCGARRVLAVDVDPVAVEVAREVLRGNSVGDRVEVRCTVAGELDEGWDGVVANILAPFFLEQARDVARLLRPGGILVASGYLDEEATSVERALHAAGLVPIERLARAEWRAAAFRLSARATG